MINNKSKVVLLIMLLFIFVSVVYATDNDTTLDNNVATTDAIESNPTSNNQYIAKDTFDNTTHDSLTTSKLDDDYENVIYLTSSNYKKYKDYYYEANTNIIIYETIENCNLKIHNDNITISGIYDATLINSQIEVIGANNIKMTDFTMKSDDRTDYNIPILVDGNNITIDHVTFLNEKQAIIFDHYSEIYMQGDNNTISNCYFDLLYPAMMINWNVDGGDRKTIVLVSEGDNNIISNNYIHIQESDAVEYPYGTIESIIVFGSNNIIDSNNIDMNGTLFLYGIACLNDNNAITNNYIKVYSHRYSNGISLGGHLSNTTVENNTIDVVTEQFDRTEDMRDDSAYGIVITEYNYHGGSYLLNDSGVTGNIIKGNTITGSSTEMYGIEQFGGKKTEILNNNIALDGIHVMGVGIIGSDTTIDGNNIAVYGTTNQTGNPPDYLRPQTVAIYDYYSNGTVITNNNLIADHGPAVTSERSINTIINGNNMDIRNNDYSIVSRGTMGSMFINNNITSDSLSSISGGNNLVYNNNERTRNQNIPPETNNTGDINQTENTNQTIGENTETPENNNTVDDNTELPQENNNPINEDVELPEETNQTTPENNIPEEINQNIPENITEEINQTIPEEIPIDEAIQQYEEIPIPEELINENTTIPINETIPEENIITTNTTMPSEIINTTTTIPQETKDTPITNTTEINNTQKIDNPIKTETNSTIITNTTQNSDNQVKTNNTQENNDISTALGDEAEAITTSPTQSIEDSNNYNEPTTSEVTTVGATATLNPTSIKAYEVSQHEKESNNDSSDLNDEIILLAILLLSLLYGFTRKTRI